MKEKQELIIVRQLPVIEEHLKNLSKEIDEKVDKATSLVVNDETVKEVKKVKANLNKDFKDLESKRKQVKEIVEKPYKDFEKVYKEYVSDKFKNADNTLKERIAVVENTLKLETKEKLERYFNEYAISKEIEFLTFEKANFKINLDLRTEKGELTKKAKDMVIGFIDRISNDIKTIETQEYKEEILIEYKKTLDLNNSIQEVTERHKQLEQQKVAKEEQKVAKITDEEMLNKIDSLSAPRVEEKELLEGAFVVRVDDKNCFREIKQVGFRCGAEIKTLIKKGDVYYE